LSIIEKVDLVAEITLVFFNLLIDVNDCRFWYFRTDEEVFQVVNETLFKLQSSFFSNKNAFCKISEIWVISAFYDFSNV